ncbi:hypothetical protein GCM10018783_18580 [Streptomyces griseosporeus]|nr:hypothetical protein GCM10018783_18580 [Streptomyces griseosporeus]
MAVPHRSFAAVMHHWHSGFSGAGSVARGRVQDSVQFSAGAADDIERNRCGAIAESGDGVSGGGARVGVGAHADVAVT